MAINIYFTFGKDNDGNDIVITLPVLPEELKMTYAGNNETQEVVKIGEINILKLPKLMDTTIESFFPVNELVPYNKAKGSAYKNPQELVNFFTKIQNSEQPCKITITGIINKETVTTKTTTKVNLSQVSSGFKQKVPETSVTVDSFQFVKIMSVEHFEWWLKQDNDIYYKLDLKEFKDYGTKTFKKIYDTQADGTLVFKGFVEKEKPRPENFTSKAVKAVKVANQTVRTVNRMAGIAKKSVNTVRGAGTFIKTTGNTISSGKIGI